VTPSADRAASQASAKRILGLALPALGVLAAEPLYLLFDIAVVGRLGALALAGLAVGGLILYAVLRIMARWDGRSPSAWGLVVFLGGFWVMILFFVLVAPAIGLLWWLATGRPDGRGRRNR